MDVPQIDVRVNYRPMIWSGSFSPQRQLGSTFFPSKSEVVHDFPSEDKSPKVSGCGTPSNWPKWRVNGITSHVS